MKRTLPKNPMAGQPAPLEDESSFDAFAGNTGFLRSVLHPHFPEPNTGAHVPVWLSPKIAREILAAHGQSGHAIPHPNIDLKRLDK